MDGWRDSSPFSPVLLLQGKKKESSYELMVKMNGYKEWRETEEVKRDHQPTHTLEDQSCLAALDIKKKNLGYQVAGGRWLIEFVLVCV